MGEDCPLAGLVVGLAESRELDLLAKMFAEKGATPFRCPLIAIRDAPNPEPVNNWIERLIAGEMTDLILLTGEGLRRLVNFAERAGLKEPFVAAVGSVRKITRGPKPTKALREIGLSTDLPASAPTTEGIIATLEQEALEGRTIGVQLYGQVPNERLVSFLAAKGARVDTVAPYIYADDEETARVLEMVDALTSGQIHLLVFTSASQIDRLWSVAKGANRQEELRAALLKTKIAAVGPVVADVLKEYGFEVQIMPADAYFMRPLLNAVVRDYQGS